MGAEEIVALMGNLWHTKTRLFSFATMIHFNSTETSKG